MTDDTPTNDDADDTDDSSKYIIPIEVDLSDDEVHGAAMQQILAASATRESALDGLGERVNERIDAKAIIYERCREIEAQRERVGQQLGDGGR